MAKDYYTTLGVSKSATEAEIKKAYRTLAHKFHPDKASGNETKFKELNEAYQVIGNAEKRAKYDQYGESFEQMGGWGAATGGASWEDIMRGFRQGGGFGGSQGAGAGSSFSFDLGDIFSEFFGGGFQDRGSGTRSRSSRGRDIEASLEIEFNESIFGAEKMIELERFEKCSHCKGNRAEPGTAIVECTECKGSGEITQTRSTVFGMMRQTAICPRCKGEGKFPKQNCKKCNGDGMERARKKIKLTIPAGIKDGETLRLQNEGEISEDGARHGNLYVHIRAREHYKFKRKGDDVYSVEPISFTQAVLGDKIRVDTIDGKVDLKIPPGTAFGTSFKLKKKGAPHLRGYGAGDHFVTVKIVMPEHLSRRARKLLEELKEEGV